jgi:hypothetical protein
MAPRAKASIPPICLCTFRIKYRAVKSSAGVPRSVEVSAPSWSCTRHGGQGAQPGTGPAWGASRSVGQPGPPHHDALRSLCLVSASWESVGRRDPTARLGGRNPHGSRPPASLPDATNVNASAPHAILPERVLSFPDFFLPAYSTRAPTDRVAVIFDS